MIKRFEITGPFNFLNHSLYALLPHLAGTNIFFPLNCWPNNILYHYQGGLCSDISNKPVNMQNMSPNNSYPGHHFDRSLLLYLKQTSWIVSSPEHINFFLFWCGAPIREVYFLCQPSACVKKLLQAETQAIKCSIYSVGR